MTSDATSQTEQIRERLRRGEDEARELGHEVADITQELRRLAADEMQLGIAEVKEQVNFAIRGAVLGVSAFIFAEFVVVFLGLAVMFALDTALATWAAALITAGIFLVLTAILALLARAYIKRVKMKPQRLIQSIKEDITWARNQIRSNGT